MADKLPTPLNEDAVAQFAEFLELRNLRLTPARAALVRLCTGEHRHFRIYELQRELLANRIEVSPATVYRTLRLMTEAGLLRRFEQGEASPIYEPIVGFPHHDHLECQSCGRLVEMHCASLEARQEEVAAAHGFQLIGHSLHMTGICSDCWSEAGDHNDNR